MRTIAAAALLMLGALACASAEDSAWSKDATTGCEVWNPYPKPEETVRWQGDCVDGRASGKGTVAWFAKGQLSEQWEGTMVGGILVGQVHETDYDEDGEKAAEYWGEYHHDSYDGKGIKVWHRGERAGCRYEGEWRDFKFNGSGTLTCPNEESLSGQWRDGELVP